MKHFTSLYINFKLNSNPFHLYSAKTKNGLQTLYRACVHYIFTVTLVTVKLEYALGEAKLGSRPLGLGCHWCC